MIEPCTDYSASWCHNCGDCTCIEDYILRHDELTEEEKKDVREMGGVSQDSRDCPLHAFGSAHGTITKETIARLMADAKRFHHWNYRVLADSVPTGLGDFEEVYTIIEVHYTKDNEIVAWSEASVPHGGTMDELFDDAFTMAGVAQRAKYVEIGTCPLDREETYRALTRDDLPGGQT